MKYVALVASMIVSSALAESEEDILKSCGFVSGWANKAYHISHTIGLEEENWKIAEEGFSPNMYALIIAIKREAYHDLNALRRRVNIACGIETES